MRIAFVSYEYAGVASGGGIGTYVRNAAAMLAGRGHEVEVFCGQGQAAPDGGVRVHAVGGAAEDFAEAALPLFAARQAARPFDVVEGPEYGADAAPVARAFPDLPLVVRLHTPRFVIRQMDLAGLTWARKARYMLGGLRRGQLPQRYWLYDPAEDPERAHALAADEIVAPSQAVLDRLGPVWGLPGDRCALVPNVYRPDPRLLSIDPATATGRVLFLGRFEVRKGVLTLARAIPLVLARRPDARFRLVGRDTPDPISGANISDIVRRLVEPHGACVEIVGPAPYDEVPHHLGECDVCVLPSRWEASGYACQEAMAAARGVVASSAGGMAEILDGGRCGVLAPPDDPRALADALLDLLNAPERRIALGRAARERVALAYGPEAVAPLQEASYHRAIVRAAQRRRAA